MELTVIGKARFEALMQDIKNLETQIAIANSQLRAMQESNNQLAEIAFDEGKFTQLLMDKVDDVAREAARDTIDVDDIASEVNDRLDIADDVHRVIERMDLQTGDDVNDRVEDVLSQYDYASKDEVEEMIEEAKEEIIERVVEAIVNKLTAKENHNAADNNQTDHSLQVSGTIGQSQAGSMLCASPE